MTARSIHEEVWEMRGADGLIRRGVLSLPGPGLHARAVVLLLPAGMTYRVAPSRLHVKLARRLAELGHACLRIDTLGLGESEGEIETAPTRQLWGSIETGRFVDDALLALRTLRERAVADKIVVAGLCGGAVTGLMAVARAPELVDGMISMDAVSVRSDQPGQAPRTLTKSETHHRLKDYLLKLAAPEAWRRLVTRESDFHAIRTTLTSFTRWLAGKGAKDAESAANPRFTDSFRFVLAKRIKHLMVFGGNTRHWHAFESLFLGAVLKGKMKGDACEIVVIPEASHEFYLPEWRKALYRSIEEWLAREYPS